MLYSRGGTSASFVGVVVGGGGGTPGHTLGLGAHLCELHKAGGFVALIV